MIGIEVVASVNRENAIYLTGETAYVVVCFIIFYVV